MSAAPTKCELCHKKVTALSRIKVNDMVWHKSCFQCDVCDLRLTAKTARICEGITYCIKHSPRSGEYQSSVSNEEGRNAAEERELLYFHGEMNRKEAEKQLKSKGHFLLRWSTNESAYVVSVKHQKDILHVKVPRTGQFFVFRNETIPYVGEWVQRHIDTKTPVASTDVLLTHPVNRPDPQRSGTYQSLIQAQTPRNELLRKSQRFSSFDEVCQLSMSSICEVKADCIVSSIGVDTSMWSGALSKAVARVGGPEIQIELDKFRQKSREPPNFGNVIETRGYSLPCKYIFHTILKGWQEASQAVQDLRQILKKIFRLADERKLTSLAIPPIGTGLLGYPKQIVAQVLYSEVSNYLDYHPDSSISKVIFAVNGEQELSEIFTKLMNKDCAEEPAYTKLNQDADYKHYEQLNEEYLIATSEESKAQSKLDLQTFRYPKNWSLTKYSEKPHDVIELDPMSAEYKDVVANIISSNGQSYENFIAKISRIENGMAYALYESIKKLMIRTNGREVQNERLLWHGTNSQAIDNIIGNGFNRAYAGAHATLFGKGVYFAKNFSYSADPLYSPPEQEFGLKHIFQCRVLTGNCCEGEEGLLEPKLLPDNSRRCDSAVDDVNDPTIFVVFRDFMAYPEYLIRFYENSPDYYSIQS